METLTRPVDQAKAASNPRAACTNCRSSHVACSHEIPCSRCVSHGLEDSCVYLPRKRRTDFKKQKVESDIKRKRTSPQQRSPGRVASLLEQQQTQQQQQQRPQPKKYQDLSRVQLVDEEEEEEEEPVIDVDVKTQLPPLEFINPQPEDAAGIINTSLTQLFGEEYPFPLIDTNVLPPGVFAGQEYSSDDSDEPPTNWISTLTRVMTENHASVGEQLQLQQQQKESKSYVFMGDVNDTQLQPYHPPQQFLSQPQHQQLTSSRTAAPWTTAAYSVPATQIIDYTPSSDGSSPVSSPQTAANTALGFLSSSSDDLDSSSSLSSPPTPSSPFSVPSTPAISSSVMPSSPLSLSGSQQLATTTGSKALMMLQELKQKNERLELLLRKAMNDIKIMKEREVMYQGLVTNFMREDFKSVQSQQLFPLAAAREFDQLGIPGIAMFSLAGKNPYQIVQCNQTFQVIVGRTWKELNEGFTCCQMFPPRILPLLQQRFNTLNCADGPYSQEGELVIARPSGEEVAVKCYSHVIFDSTGAPLFKMFYVFTI